MECKAEREPKGKNRKSAGHDKRAIKWDVIELAEKERRAQKKRKIIKRQRRKAFQEFITVAFHGKREIDV